MGKFINIVNVKVKDKSKKNYIKKIKNITNFDGLISSKHIAINSSTYCMIEEWNSKEDLEKARKKIEIFDKIKPLIREKSSEIDIMDSISGSIIIEKDVKKKEINDLESSSLDIKKKSKKHFYFIYDNS